MAEHRQASYKQTFSGKGAAKRKQVAVNLRKERRLAEISKRRKELDTTDEGGMVQTFNAEDMHKALAKISSGSEQDRGLALQSLRAFLSCDQGFESLDTLINSGVIKVLLGVIVEAESVVAEHQFAALCCLTNIATGSYEQTKSVLEAAPALLALLSSSSSLLQEQAAWCFGNLAGEDIELRHTLVQNGVGPPLVQLLSHSSASLVAVSLWAISNCLKGPGTSLAVFDQAGLFDQLCKLLMSSPDEKVLSEALWVLTRLCNFRECHSGPTPPQHPTQNAQPLQHPSSTYIAMLIQRQLLARVAVAIAHPSHGVVLPAVRLAGALTSDPVHASTCSNLLSQASSTVPALLHCATSQVHRGIKKEACWVLANITGADDVVRAAVLQHNPIPALCNLFAHTQYDIQKELAFCLCNLAREGQGGDTEFDGVLAQVVEQEGVVATYLSLLQGDPEVVDVSLYFLEMLCARQANGPHLVEEENGIEKLEAFQTSENSEFYHRAMGIVDRYWGEEDYSGAANAQDSASSSGVANPFSGLTSWGSPQQQKQQQALPTRFQQLMQQEEKQQPQQYQF